MQLWIFPLQLASLDTSGPHACYDHTHAWTMQQDITTAQQGLWMRMSALLLLLVAFLGRIKGTRAKDHCIRLELDRHAPGTAFFAAKGKAGIFWL